MSAQSALSCTGKCSAAMRDQNCTGSREVQSAREQKPQHRRLFPTKSIKHRTPCHHFRARFWRLTLFHHADFVLLVAFWPPFVLRADQSLSSERLRTAIKDEVKIFLSLLSLRSYYPLPGATYYVLTSILLQKNLGKYIEIFNGICH